MCVHCLSSSVCTMNCLQIRWMDFLLIITLVVGGFSALDHTPRHYLNFLKKNMRFSFCYEILLLILLRYAWYGNKNSKCYPSKAFELFQTLFWIFFSAVLTKVFLFYFWHFAKLILMIFFSFSVINMGTKISKHYPSFKWLLNYSKRFLNSLLLDWNCPKFGPWG